MKIIYIIAAFVAVTLSSCATPLTISKVETVKNIAIAPGLPEDQTIKSIIAPYRQELEGQMNTKISHTSVDLTKQGDNSSLGNLLADFTFEGAEAWAAKNNITNGIDAAVINIGGIRTTISAGDIITKQVYEVMPFENELMIVKLQGSDIQGLFDYYLRTKKNNPVSRITIKTDGETFVEHLINGQAINPAKEYYIATSDYLAFGGDQMDYFKKGEIISTGIKLRDLFLEKFIENPEIKVPTDIRLEFKNKKSNTDE